MGRDIRQGTRGSKKWLSMLVNTCPELLNAKILREIGPVANEIRWRSPLEDDGYAEYYDGDFIDKLGIRLEKRQLKSFWPPSGPRWDGLGVTNNGQVFILEAKAHVKELRSECRAKSHRSKCRIDSSLSETKAFMDVPKEADWKRPFYQYATRLAHLYLLHALNEIDGYLVYVYFMGAKEMERSTSTMVPRTVREWKCAVLVEKMALGLRSGHKLSDRIVNVFVNVKHITAVQQIGE